MTSNDHHVEPKGAVQVVAEGLIYAVDVETPTDDVDWLDKVLQQAALEPRKVDELLAAFPLPRRFMENALARLLERNLMLLNVYYGTVRASPLRQVTVGRSAETFLVWQDHATGMLIPFDRVSMLEMSFRQVDEASANMLRIRGGAPRRTPLEMSDAELLHHLRRYKLNIDAKAEVKTKSRVRRSTLSVRGLLLEDGRLALKDAVPWPLRISWARLSTSQTVAATTDGDDFALPPRWEEMIGRWAYEARERLLRKSRMQRSLAPLIRILAADLSVVLADDGPVATKRLAREARSSLVVAVSGRFGNAGDAVQILKESNVTRRVLVVTTAPGAAKRELWESQGIDVVVASGTQESPDFVLIDGQILIFGGIAAASSRVITIRSHSSLDGYVAWLNELGIMIPVEERASSLDLIADLQAFEYEITDLQGEAATAIQKADENPSSDPEGVNRIRAFLNDRCGAIEGRLVQRDPSPFAWLSPAEVSGIVEHSPGARVLVRTVDSSLGGIANAKGVECATWPAGEVAADCVILDKEVLFGFSVGSDGPPVPDFLAVADSNIAAELRIATGRFPRMKTSNDE